MLSQLEMRQFFLINIVELGINRQNIFYPKTSMLRIGIKKALYNRAILTLNYYFTLLYSSSDTGSNHSGVPAVIAMCTNQLSFVAPCQCFTPSWVTITSPAFNN
ncbi:hypothetical protein QF028_002377 [Neobacillus sp. B4I6]